MSSVMRRGTAAGPQPAWRNSRSFGRSSSAGSSTDFSENGLIGIAQRATNAKNFDDGLAYLQTNLEYYPKSVRTYQAMAQARNAKGDKPGAVRDLEKAAELDPSNAQVRNQLQQLKGQ